MNLKNMKKQNDVIAVVNEAAASFEKKIVKKSKKVIQVKKK